MITPSPLYDPYDCGVVEPDQGEQDWLRAEQAIFTAAGLPFGEKYRHETLDGFRWLAESAISRVRSRQCEANKAWA
jgi:hypothetical protein